MLDRSGGQPDRGLRLPLAAHDDQVDALSGAAAMAAQHAGLAAIREAAQHAVQIEVRTNFGPTGRENELEKLLRRYK